MSTSKHTGMKVVIGISWKGDQLGWYFGLYTVRIVVVVFAEVHMLAYRGAWMTEWEKKQEK
jgi:hypothetical protein